MTRNDDITPYARRIRRMLHERMNPEAVEVEVEIMRRLRETSERSVYHRAMLTPLPVESGGAAFLRRDKPEE